MGAMVMVCEVAMRIFRWSLETRTTVVGGNVSKPLFKSERAEDQGWNLLSSLLRLLIDW